MISDQTGEISTVVKLMRVACLVPVVIIISLATHRKRSPESGRAPLLPWFLVAFVVLVVVNSTGRVPVSIHDVMTPLSSWCLLTAVAAPALADPATFDLSYRLHEDPTDPNSPVTIAIRLSLEQAASDGEAVGWEIVEHTDHPSIPGNLARGKIVQ